ncbi:MAG: CHAT domain-containing tetratricopeptide repeat protein [Bacteroidota bacterium]
MNKRHLIHLVWLFLIVIGHATAKTPLSKRQDSLSLDHHWNNRYYKRATELEQAGKPLAAVSFYQKALQRFEKKKQWYAYMTASHRLGRNCLNREDFASGIEVINTALTQLERNAPGSLKNGQRLYQLQFDLYKKEQKTKEALTVSDRQLLLLHSLYRKIPHWDLVKAYHHRAQLQQQLKTYKEAVESALKAKEIAESLYRENYGLTSRTYKLLHYLYRQTGAYTEGVELLKTALSYASSHPRAKEEDICLYYLELGNYQTTFNESRRAIEYFEKVLFLIQESETAKKTVEKQYGLSRLYSRLGVNFLNIKDCSQASRYFTKSIEQIKNRTDKMAIKRIVQNLTSIGSIYSERNLYDTATYYYEQADSLLDIAIASAADANAFFHQKRHILWHAGSNALNRGDLDQAKRYFLEVLEKFSVEDRQWDDVGTLFYLGIIAEEQNDWPSALYYNHLGIIALCRTFNNPDYLQLPALEDFRELGNTYWLLNQKARYLSLSAQQEADSVKKERHLEAAIRTVDLFDQVHNRGLKKMNILRDGQNTTIIETSLMNYKEGISIAHRDHRSQTSHEVIEKGFYYTQKMKSQHLWMNLLMSEATTHGNVPETFVEKEKNLQEEILHYEQKLLEAEEAGDSNMVAVYEHLYLFEKRNDYRELMLEMEAHYPAYYESKFAFTPQSSASLQPILKGKELLIEYVFSDEALFAFTLSHDQPLRMHRLPLDKQLFSRIDSLHELLQASSWMRKSRREQFIKLSHHLYQQLLEPLETQLQGKERLIIIGDGMMNYIPFEVLLPNPTVAAFHKLDYLIRRFELSYHYSASLFARARQKEKSAQSGIFAFAPVYEQSEHKVKQVAQTTIPSKLRTFRQDCTYAPLPESEREVKTIAQLFGEAEQDTSNQFLAIRQNADETTLKNHLSMPYKYIHIAGHSFANLEHPKFSGIACFSEKESTTSKEDGVLYAGEIYNIKTQADLVILSSCESGFGKLELAEGLMGLNRAFIFNGTPNVVFSLWKVYDKINAKVMIDFYREVFSGQSYSSSLRQAKLELLAKPETAAPHYWSPYLLIGC